MCKQQDRPYRLVASQPAAHIANPEYVDVVNQYALLGL
jgi:hypothetical protein